MAAFRPPRLLPIGLLLLISVLAAIRLHSPAVVSPSPQLTPLADKAQPERAFELPPRWAVVTRAVDGDTLLLEGGERVRLFGVNTPETKVPNQPPQPFGMEATAFTSSLVNGRQIRLEFDMERFDKYGRTLAYVYVGEVFLNEALIQEGLSAAHLQYPFRSDMKRRFASAERLARDQKKGIWSLPDATSQHPRNQRP